MPRRASSILVGAAKCPLPNTLTCQTTLASVPSQVLCPVSLSIPESRIHPSYGRRRRPGSGQNQRDSPLLPGWLPGGGTDAQLPGSQAHLDEECDIRTGDEKHRSHEKPRDRAGKSRAEEGV